MADQQYPKVGDRVRVTSDTPWGFEPAPAVGAVGTVVLDHAAEGYPERLWVKFEDVPEHPLSLGNGWPFEAGEVEVVES